MYSKKVKLSQASKDKLLRGDIQIVAGTRDLADKIIESEKDGEFQEGIGLRFVFPYEDSTIGIDNSTGDAWTEEFSDYDTCLAWLCGQFDIGDL